MRNGGSGPDGVGALHGCLPFSGGLGENMKQNHPDTLVISVTWDCSCERPRSSCVFLLVLLFTYPCSLHMYTLHLPFLLEREAMPSHLGEILTSYGTTALLGTQGGFISEEFPHPVTSSLQASGMDTTPVMNDDLWTRAST